MHLQVVQRKTIFYSVSIPDKDYSKQIQWNHQNKLYFLYYNPEHALDIWKELYAELFWEGRGGEGRGVVSGFFDNQAKPKQTLICFG